MQLSTLKRLLDGESCDDVSFGGNDIRTLLLEAIVTNKKDVFKEHALKIGDRKISTDSDWCHDDYLIFLLLLGNERFGRPINFLNKVLEVRQATSNVIPRRINEVFASLNRQEFGLDGAFGFLKIPFLFLIQKLKLTDAGAGKALHELSEVLDLEKLPPFIQLLTQKAYDLILLERQPVPFETAEQVIESFEKFAKEFTLRQWREVIWRLPSRILWSIFATIVG